MVEDKTHSRLYTLLITCAWCKKDMGVKKTNKKITMDVTHSLCPECYDVELSKIGELNENRSKT